MTIRVAAIGVSHWHSLYDSAYLKQLSAMPDVEIVGMQDDMKHLALHRASVVGIAAPIFTDYRRMLDEVKPSFVLALGRHDNMAETAGHLLDRQIPFIMEKPMSFNSKQLATVVEKARLTSGFAAVPLSMRTSPFFIHVKNLIKKGQYGPLCHFYQRMNRPTSDRYIAWDSPWMLDPAIANGGCLRNLGVHALDTFINLTGGSHLIEVTGAQLSWATHSRQVEDYASVLLRTKKGVLGTIEVGNGFPTDGTDEHTKVAFREAIISIVGESIILETSRGILELPSICDSTSVLRRTLDAAVAGYPPPVSVEDCYKAVRLIDMAYIAAGNPYGTAEV